MTQRRAGRASQQIAHLRGKTRAEPQGGSAQESDPDSGLEQMLQALDNNTTAMHALLEHMQDAVRKQKKPVKRSKKVVRKKKPARKKRTARR